MFTDKMIRQGKQMGMTITRSSNLIFKRLSVQAPKKDLENEFIKLKNLALVVVIPGAKKSSCTKNAYGYVIEVTELNLAILTQCVCSETVYKAQGGSIANILLKVNAKLNGINYSPDVPLLCLRKSCTIMGADVSHPSVESKDTMPSVAAVTASHDPKAFQYNISCRFQPPRQEKITDLQNIVKEHLLFLLQKKSTETRAHNFLPRWCFGR